MNTDVKFFKQPLGTTNLVHSEQSGLKHTAALVAKPPQNVDNADPFLLAKSPVPEFYVS
jgi:hypothetical protein